MKIWTGFKNWITHKGIRATEFFGVIFSIAMLLGIIVIVLSGVIFSHC